MSGRGDACPARLEVRGDDVLIWIKAVPNASRDEIAGVVGDRLKIRVGAPPEGGKANKAICKLLAKKLGVKASAVTVEQGAGAAEKVVRVRGLSCEAALAMIDRRAGG